MGRIIGEGREQAVRREKQLIFSGESRGRGLGIMHKDASPCPWHKQVNLPDVTLSLGQEPAARQLALQGFLDPH